jgi:hypothetical protein
MRRLTPFEKKIVEKIYYSEVNYLLTIRRLVDDYIMSSTGFILEPIDDVYTLSGYYLEPEAVRKATFKNSKIQGVIEEKLIEVKKDYKIILDTINLLILLEKNGYIYLISNNSEPKKRYFPHNFEIKHSSLYKKCLERVITEIEYDTLTNRTVLPSAALEVFVNNEYRTEEQKANDDNRETGRKTLIAAVCGLFLTAIFSAFTLLYTIFFDKRTEEYDRERDKIEDDRYKEDASAEAKKELRNNFYRNEVMTQVDKVSDEIDSIRKDLKNK